MLAEFGLVFPQSPEALGRVLAEVLEDASNELTGIARLVLQRAHLHWIDLDLATPSACGTVQSALGRPMSIGPGASCSRLSGHRAAKRSAHASCASVFRLLPSAWLATALQR